MENEETKELLNYFLEWALNKGMYTLKHKDHGGREYEMDPLDMEYIVEDFIEHKERMARNRPTTLDEDIPF